jgi:hypothetical protein
LVRARELENTFATERGEINRVSPIYLTTELLC